MKNWVKFSLFVFFFAALSLLATFEHVAWAESFTTEVGATGTAHFSILKWRHLVDTHVFSMGGKPISSTASFYLDNHRCQWASKRNERIFVVQFSLQKWYAISVDRTSSNRWVTRFYKGDDGSALKEIEAHDYPIKLAIQNLWLIDEMVKVNSTFHSNPQASFSFMARAWWKIFHEEDVKEVDSEFITNVAKMEFPGRINFLPPPPLKMKIEPRANQ